MKYSNHGLTLMGKNLMIAKETGDRRYLQFLLTMAVKTGQSVEAIERKINEYANGIFF